MIATLNNNIILPFKNLKRHSWIVICIFMFLILSGAFSASVSADQTEKQQLEIEIINLPKEPVFEKATYTFKFRVKDSQINQESITYSWRLDYKEWSTFSPETSVLLKEANLTVGMHRFQARAKDEDGNVGTAAVALFKVIPDAQPPDTKITTEVPDLIKSNNFTFQFESNDQLTPKEKLQYSWRIDLGRWSEFSHQTSVHLSNLKDGVHSFEVKARDESGNEDATLAKVSFEVAIQKPNTVIIDLPEIVETIDITFRFSGTDLQTPTEKLQYSWRLDNQRWTPFSTKTIAELTNLSNGMHQFDVKARDEDGNEDSSYAKAVFRVEVNIEFPNTETQIISGPNGNIIFYFKGTDVQTPDELQYAWRVGKVNEVDKKAWSSPSSETTVHLSNLPEGTYIFQVKARDADGNADPTPADASFEVTVEKIPETTITNAPAEPIKTSEYIFHFNATNLQPPIQYFWRLDGEKWKFTTDTSATVNNLTNGTHLFQVKAKDTDGNESAIAEASFEVIIEKILPEVEITKLPDTPLKQNSFTFQFRVTNSQTSVKYSWRLDGGKWSGFSKETTATVGPLTNGVHLFQVKAKDTEGNETPTFAESRFEVVIKKIFPEVSIINATDAPLKQNDFTFHFQVTNLQTPVQYSWRLDGGKWSEFSKDTNATLKNLKNGVHLFQVKAKDAEENESLNPAEAKFEVAIDSPETNIINAPIGPLESADFTFRFEGTDAQTSKEKLQYSWRLDDGDWSEFQPSTQVRLEKLTNGNYIFQVKAKDEDDNGDPTPAVVSFEVAINWKLPQTEIIEPPDVVESVAFTFHFLGTDRKTPKERLQYSWRLDRRTWSKPSSQTSYRWENLNDGIHRFEVKAIDEDGNEDATSAEVEFTVAVNEQLPQTRITTNEEIVKKADIEIEFSGADKQTPNHLVYAWKLDNEVWSEFSADTKVWLTKLSDGSHLFRVKAKDPQGNEDPNPPEYIFTVDLPVSPLLIVAVVLSTLLALSVGYYLFHRWRQKLPSAIAAWIYRKLAKNLQMIPREMYEICDKYQTAIEIFQYLSQKAEEKNSQGIAAAADIFAAILSQPGNPIDGLIEQIQGLAALEGAEAEAFHGYLLNLSEGVEANTISEIVAQGQFLLQRIFEPSFPDFILVNRENILKEMKELLEQLSNSERSGDAHDKSIYLEQAYYSCNQARIFAEQQLTQPDKMLFNFLFTQWITAIDAARKKLMMSADLEIALRTKEMLWREEIDLVLEFVNVGLGNANNINATLRSSKDFEFIGLYHERKALASQQSTQFSFRIHSFTKKTISVEFEITYNDQESREKHTTFADIVHFIQIVEKYEPIENPYIVGPPVTEKDSKVFYGREDIFEFIQSIFVHEHQGEFIVLYGERRTGKTSILYQLTHRLDEHYIPVFVDVHGIIDPGNAIFLYSIAESIEYTLYEKDIEVECPPLSEFEYSAGMTFLTFLDCVQKALGDRILILMIDEYQEIEFKIKRDDLKPDILNFFRSIVQHSRNIRLIFSGVADMRELTAEYWSVFLGIAIYEEISYLKEDNARRLIIEPVESWFKFDDSAINRIIDLTNRHPYFVQLVCYSVLNRQSESGLNSASVEHVDTTIDNVVERGHTHLDFLWGEQNKKEQTILSALAQCLTTQAMSTETDMLLILEEHNLTLQPNEIREILAYLVSQGVLVGHKHQDTTRYSFTIPIFQRWIVKNNPPHSVIREMKHQIAQVA